TWQVLFPDEAGARELEEAGMALRVSWQFHWRNERYRSIDDFLARFNSKRRHMLRREMAAPAEQGIEIRTIRGEELRREPARWAKAAHALHRSTVDKLMWGRRWLNEKFYLAAFAGMSDAIEVVAAFRGGELIAGAFNVASPTRLYGRYWGCFEEHPFLHFNVCYYHSIADCIARNLQVFEGGAGGEHKLPRGFLPALTYSAHGFTDAKLDRAVRQHLARETPHRLDGRGIEKGNHRAREHRGEHQHDAHLRRRARERQSTDGEQHAGGAHRERTRRRAQPVRDSTPDQRGRSRHGLLRERDRADLLAGEPQPAQVWCEVGKEGSDARVMKEVEPAQPPDHPGASSGSIVHSSGNAAFSASARVSCTLVSAISKV
ncbi:MAG TPA: GNAT family N-acetyltransferase, partial [Myxococcales bacterium]|nr:GNAT family N-acetyltransferase [Myxococcales bacterium]